jgi:uncharacterized membrane protein
MNRTAVLYALTSAALFGVSTPAAPLRSVMNSRRFMSDPKLRRQHCIGSKGLRLDEAGQIRLHAKLIEINAVRSHAMPPGNITEITAEERQVLAAWIAAGARDN